MRIILFCVLLSFLITLISARWVIKYLRKIDLLVKDMNKKDMLLVPISGGILVLGGVIFGLLVFIFLQTFYYTNTNYVINIFAVMNTFILITLVGFVDDLLINKSKNESGGLKQWQKPILTLFASIPLIVINAGNSIIYVPFLGNLNFGLIYPLVLIPVGVVGAANMVNMLAGYNGLEAGMGLIYTFMLGLYGYFNGSYLGTLISLITFSSLVIFYYNNKI